MSQPEKRLDFTGDNAVLIYISIFKFLLLVLFAGNYGLFRDEFYYLECSKHLDWGYVDQPPFSILVLAVSRILFGESILGIRIFAYAASCGIIFVTGLIAREMSGNKFAQSVSAFAAVFCGTILGAGSIFSMNSFDILFSSLIFFLLIRLIKSENKKLWIPLGIIFGIGLQNKLSPVFIAFGLAVGMALTKHRKYFLSKELYIGAAIAFLIFLPNIIWQIANSFPTIEFMRNAASRKNQPLGVIGFLSGSIMELNPFFIFFLLTAIYFLVFNKTGRQFALIAWTLILIFFVFVFFNGKPYYMGILFPVIIAAGVVGAEILIDKYINSWGRYALIILILIPAAVSVTPFAIPVLNVEAFIGFSGSLGVKPGSGERQHLGILPQFYADRFGWKEMVEEVAAAYNKLSEDEKKNVVIFAQNYGEAGAIDYYGKQYGLPKAYSAHNNYWFWGPPQNFNGEAAIVVGSNKQDNSKFFEQVELSGTLENKYAMPYENVGIFICRKAKISLQQGWAKLKIFI